MYVNPLHMVLLYALTGAPNPEVIQLRAQAIHAHVQPNDAKALSQAIQEASARFEVPSYIVTAVIEHESLYNIKAKSKSGCIGAMQLLPKTAHKMARLLGIKKPNLKNPKTNVLLGTAYLAQLFGFYHNWGATLTAYNIGPGGYAKRKRPNGYAKAILKNIPIIKQLEKDLDKPTGESYNLRDETLEYQKIFRKILKQNGYSPFSYKDGYFCSFDEQLKTPISGLEIANCKNAKDLRKLIGEKR